MPDLPPLALAPPLAPRRPRELVAHGDRRSDDWYWLADRDDPEVVAYLQAENVYLQKAMAGTEALQSRLYDEMRSRIKETDVGAPTRKGGWWYYSRTVEGRQYALHCRRPVTGEETAADVLAAELAAADSADAADRAGQEDRDEVVLLDENERARGSDYFALGVFDISPDSSRLAYAVDQTGAERYILRFRDLATGVDLDGEITNVYYSSAWSADGTTLFYTRPDEAVRPWQVWRHAVGRPAEEDVLVFQEDDERFFVQVGLTRSERYVVITTSSKLTSEVHVADAHRPNDPPRVVEPRRQGVEYSVEHARLPGRGDTFLIVTNDDGAENFALIQAPATDPGKAHWAVRIPHRAEVRLEGVDAFANHLVVYEREQGLEQVRVISLADGGEHVIAQPEPVYSLSGSGNPEFDTADVRFGYTSLVTPASAIEYDMTTRSRRVVKQQPVLGGYKPDRFETSRLWATAPDGVKVPISIVRRRDLAPGRGSPCLLYGYGAYEVTIDPVFSSLRLNLLERGFVFAIAHVRGGGELGRGWYLDGKLLKKRNTFTDFIACAEHLIAEGYTTPDRLVIRGGSAGGLLIGAAINFRPDLWRAAVAEVPFVDCLTTMQDERLPLTITEWEEWGNPIEDPEVYAYMKSYSPYDNVSEHDYPAMYVTAGLNDPRVGYWEPAKWVAKLRHLRTGGPKAGTEPLLLLKTELDAGHAGPSGRYDAWRDEARVQAFVLGAVGVVE
jgi:oligopeptidase B